MRNDEFSKYVIRRAGISCKSTCRVILEAVKIAGNWFQNNQWHWVSVLVITFSVSIFFAHIQNSKI